LEKGLTKVIPSLLIRGSYKQKANTFLLKHAQDKLTKTLEEKLSFLTLLVVTFAYNNELMNLMYLKEVFKNLYDSGKRFFFYQLSKELVKINTNNLPV
jgi:hypothetical protein